MFIAHKNWGRKKKKMGHLGSSFYVNCSQKLGGGRGRISHSASSKVHCPDWEASIRDNSQPPPPFPHRVIIVCLLLVVGHCFGIGFVLRGDNNAMSPLPKVWGR